MADALTLNGSVENRFSAPGSQFSAQARSDNQKLTSCGDSLYFRGLGCQNLNLSRHFHRELNYENSPSCPWLVASPRYTHASSTKI
jgi:hypothetical protein